MQLYIHGTLVTVCAIAIASSKEQEYIFAALPFHTKQNCVQISNSSGVVRMNVTIVSLDQRGRVVHRHPTHWSDVYRHATRMVKTLNCVARTVRCAARTVADL